MKSYKGVLILGGICIFACLFYRSDGAQKIDVHAEINKMTEKFEQFEKPSPAVVNTVMEQVRESCKTNRTIDNESISVRI